MKRIKKKGAPVGTPINLQINGTTPETKSHAQTLFDKIGTGKDWALKRPSDARTDRELRQLIAAANMSGDCIINVGTGYFRPGDDDSADLELYLNAERRRAKGIREKIKKMQEVYDRRYQTWE